MPTFWDRYLKEAKNYIYDMTIRCMLKDFWLYCNEIKLWYEEHNLPIPKSLLEKNHGGG